MITLSKTQEKILKDTIESGSDLIQKPTNLYGNALDTVLHSMLGKGLILKTENDYIITDIARQTIKCPQLKGPPINTITNEPTICFKPKSQLPPETERTTKKPRKGTKQALLVNLLKQPQGTTMDEMVKVTMWQKHTVRGTLSHAIKKRLGYLVESAKNADNVRIYRIIEA